MNTPDRQLPIDEMLLKKSDSNKLSPSEALELERQLLSQPSPDGVYAPITLASPTDIAPVAYVMHNFTSRCLACNTEHKWTEIYALNHLRTPSGRTFVRHLIPITKLEWNVPLRIHNLTTKTTPCCHECIEPTIDYLKTLKEPPVPEAILKSAAPASTPTPEKPKSGPRKTLSIDDLMD